MFERIRKSKSIKLIMAFAALNLLVEIAFPTVAMALTAGAGSPEFASFEPVATTDMVNDFTGDFTYNLPVLSVPGPDGGGYSMSLSYHGGVSSEEEASWVGFGWTLNPGAINRQKRGFADDFKNVEVTKYNKTTPNWTQSSAFNFNIEISSADQENEKKENKKSEKAKRKKARNDDKNGKTKMNLENPLKGNASQGSGGSISFSFSKSIRYNNYSGFSISTGFGANKGMGSLNMNRSAGENTLGFSINPIAIFQKLSRKKTKKLNVLSKFVLFPKIVRKALASVSQKRANRSAQAGLFSSSYSARSFEAPAVPYSIAKSSGKVWNWSASLQINVYTPIGFQVGIQGSLNSQIPESEVINRAYGYMYNPLTQESDILADYQLEKPSTFNKHDRNLGIPFNNADVFTATGNGVVGGFKLYHNQIGHYQPPYVDNKQKIRQLGVEVGVGGTLQVGFDFGLGFQRTTLSDWRVIDSDFDYSATEKPYLRFNGDMGGQIDYSESTSLLTASIGGSYLNRKLDLGSFDQGGIPGGRAELDTDKAGRTSFIEYVKGSQVDANLITGMVVTNKDGNKSAYLEPVFVHQETELTVGLKDPAILVNDVTPGVTSLPAILNDGDATPAQLVVNHPLYFDNPTLNKTAIGQRIDHPYASTYLLSSNTTFDYVDVNGNGEPDEADFGGWTKFAYRTAHTNYRYRAPYTGLFYSRGRLFDGDDQTGGMSSGIKDVKYLTAIETKTHIAFFVTNNTSNQEIENEYGNKYEELDLKGSNVDNSTGLADGANPRFDGVDAVAVSGGIDPAANSATARGNHELDKLERIVLYAKNDLSKPISTTYFEYNNTLVQNIPNTTGSGNQSGKLTLKKVWTESGGTIKSKVAPYQFEYEYFKDYSPEIIAKYPDLLVGYSQFTEGSGISAFSDQNPNYQEGQLDMWGNYRFDGRERFQKMNPWVNQRDNNPHFDPAAWQLKRIILPSGGEIHVQYEQKDYCFVQDKKAMLMTSLQDHTDFNNSYTSEDDLFVTKNKHFINLLDLGIDPNDAGEVASYVTALTTYFVNLKNKLYFKILYSYRGNYVPNLDNFNHRYDYITGYTSVNEVGVSGNSIYLSLGEGFDDKTLPRYIGFRKLHQAADRNLGWDAKNLENDDRDILASAYDATTGNSTNDIGTKGIANIFNLFADWADGDIKNYPKNKACKSLNFELSYFKLPISKAKKGGGIRVKRLLSYDPGIAGETGDAMVYGSEYIYKNTDGTSSGVATNEPQQGREESPLTTIVERNKQSGWNKMLNGRDTKTHAGPLGESLLPGASVVHERVIIKNIHTGKTTTGFAVNNYHSTRTFPMTSDFTDISKGGDSPTYKKFNLNLPLGLFNMTVNRAWVTQGYAFKLNDMHGKVESQATYAGNYNQNRFKDAVSTSKTVFKYTVPGTAIKSLLYSSSTHDFEISDIIPGQEEDLTMYRSKVTDITNDFSLELDLNINLPVFVNLGFGLSYSYTDNQLSQHVTTKVVRQKSYLISTTTTTDGVTQTTENLAFDKHTGDPVLTKTYDGYYAVDEQINTEVENGKHNGEYFAFNIPASWVYEQMGRKTDILNVEPETNVNSIYDPSHVNNTYSNQLTASVGNVVTYGQNSLYDAIVANASSWNPANIPFKNVVNASATVYKNDWFDAANPNLAALENEFIGLNSTGANSAVNKHYYPQRTYVYRDEVSNANDRARIYGGGIIINPFDFFNWNNSIDYSGKKEVNGITGTDEKWYSASEIISYSPHGYPLEEKDVLEINSTAHFGYEKTLPILVAQNAAYSQVNFTDFEFGFDPTTTPEINTDYAHSGARSYDFSLNNNFVFAEDYNITPDMISKKGLSIKLWLKSALSNNLSSQNFGLKNPNPGLKAIIGGQQYPFKRIAQTGEWSLYVTNINNFNGLVTGLYDIQLAYNFLPNEMVLVDDFRIQPTDAVMNCTVYTVDNKVAAQFDDQHFGVYYEYNNKGQLVRKSIETERGKKTLQEQQYNTPLKIR